MTVLSIINQKGGCGKTTTSANLAATLAFKGKKVLLIDFDPQGHSGLALGITAENFNYSIYNVLTDSDIPIDTCYTPIEDNLTLIPSDLRLATFEQIMAGVNNREYILKNRLDLIKNDFDFIIIDCPPHLGLLSINALFASERIIVPVEPSRYGIDGIEKLHITINALCKKAGHNLKVRYLVSMYDIDSAFAHNFVNELREQLGEELFKTHIHRTSVIREATYAGKSIIDHDQHSISFVDFMSLAHEVILWKNEDYIKEITESGLLKPRKTSVGICFMLKAQGATSVQIAGNFNNWDPERTPLSQIDGETWYAILPLENGTYKYQYVVDGVFKTDPANTDVESSLFGVSQSVVTIA